MSKEFKVGQTWRTRGGMLSDIMGVGAFSIAIRTNGNPLGNVLFLNDGGRVLGSDIADSPIDLIEQVTRVYIAGPIGSTPMEQARIPFDAAAALYRSRGCVVLNPCDLVPPGTPHAECMRIDMAALLTCDMIVMLPGWTMSRGARAEQAVAEICGLAVVWPE